MKVFHRIDDVQEYSNQMKEILDFFDDNTKEFILAVVPKCFDERFAEIINSYKHCTIYQHGYEHENHVEKGWCDEFPDSLSYNQRFSWIAKGKRRIEEILGYQINGYVPPWNNTGEETIKIISELGFSIYSAQENNTISYLKNRDVSVDVIEAYIPAIVYKDLNQVWQEVIDLSSDRSEVGIMYHFKDTKQEDWELIKKFIKRVEDLNSI